MSLSPWARIEANTHSAAMSKIRSPWARSCPRTKIEKAMVATPLGPNQAMKAFVAVSSRVPVSAIQIAIGRAASSVKATMPTAAQPSLNNALSVSSDPNTTKIPSLTISTMSSARSANVWARSDRRIPSVIAHTKTAMKPHQIISLMTFQGADNTLALSDHDDHIHVGWRPLYGQNREAAKQINAILKPEQWIKLIDRLSAIDNPTVPAEPSKAAVKAAKAEKRKSG